MKYSILLNEEDYLRFNIFYASHTKAGKRSAAVTRLLFPLLTVVIIMAFYIAGADYGLMVTEAVLLAVVSVVWWLCTPKIIERNIRKHIQRVKKEGKLPFHGESEIEFLEEGLVEKSEQGEMRIAYADIEQVYSEKDYLYLFYGAVQAFIVPWHCLGEDRECVAAYIQERVTGR